MSDATIAELEQRLADERQKNEVEWLNAIERKRRQIDEMKSQRQAAQVGRTPPEPMERYVREDGTEVKPAEAWADPCKRLNVGVFRQVCRFLADGEMTYWMHTDPTKAREVYDAQMDEVRRRNIEHEERRLAELEGREVEPLPEPTDGRSEAWKRVAEAMPPLQQPGATPQQKLARGAVELAPGRFAHNDAEGRTVFIESPDDDAA